MLRKAYVRLSFLISAMGMKKTLFRRVTEVK